LPRGVRLCLAGGGLLTRGALPTPPSQPFQASGTSARERLPLQRRDRSGFTPDSLTARRLWRRDYHRRPMTRSRVLSLWVPVVVWAGVIFALSSIPNLGTGLGTWDYVLRKGAHMTE